MDVGVKMTDEEYEEELWSMLKNGFRSWPIRREWSKSWKIAKENRSKRLEQPSSDNVAADETISNQDGRLCRPPVGE